MAKTQDSGGIPPSTRATTSAADEVTFQTGAEAWLENKTGAGGLGQSDIEHQGGLGLLRNSVLTKLLCTDCFCITWCVTTPASASGQQ